MAFSSMVKVLPDSLPTIDDNKVINDNNKKFGKAVLTFEGKILAELYLTTEKSILLKKFFLNEVLYFLNETV